MSSEGDHHRQLHLSLENCMKCGIGMCGRCNMSGKAVCKDGPVFTLGILVPPTCEVLEGFKRELIHSTLVRSGRNQTSAVKSASAIDG